MAFGWRRYGRARPDRSVPRCHRGDNLLETRIATERVQNWIQPEMKRKPVTLFEHVREPLDRLINFAAADIGEDIVRSRNVVALPALMVEFFQLSLG